MPDDIATPTTLDVEIAAAGGPVRIAGWGGASVGVPVRALMYLRTASAVVITREPTR